MTTVRGQALRSGMLGVTLLFVCVLAVGNGAPLPESSLPSLSRQARSPDWKTRELAVGHLLRRLKVGMTRTEVEALLGPPHWTPDAELIPLLGVTYYARSPGKTVTELMTIEYDTSGHPWTLRKVIFPTPFWEPIPLPAPDEETSKP